jgi:DNA polymerase
LVSGNGETKELAKYRGKARVFDILNAGPLHRFTANNVLVHNCGYGGSVGAVDAMDYSGAIPAEDRKGMVDAWRAASPNIVKFWWDVDEAAITAVKNPGQTLKTHKLEFKVESGILFIKLPSGRSLAYVRPRIEQGKFGKPQITYEGMNQVTKKWTRIETYGPKLVENIVQAASRDCLADSMLRLKDHTIVMHVHDEVIIEAPASDPDNRLTEICRVMGLPPTWAPDLPLRADGYHCDFYKKD